MTNMELIKAHWVIDEQNVNLTMPLSKVDKENRTVSGYASLDNADSQGDIMTKEANAGAFSRFRGNIREMHQPIAVGRMINFKEDNFYDTETKKFYNGIWVEVYVSKGAQDTWEKVLDGTLQGFSIGGVIKDSTMEFVKDAAGGQGRMVRFVKDYDLVELSLVDSPANKLANVFSITKSADGETVVTGMIAETNTENVFYCSEDKVAKTTSDESLQCPEGHDMRNIGWIEYSDADDMTEKVGGIVDNYLEKQATAQTEGGVNEVANEDEAQNAAVDENAENSVEEVAAAAEEEAAAAEVSEVADVESDLSEKFDGLKTELQESISKNATAVEEALETFTTKFEELQKGIETKISELGEKHAELSEKVAGLKEDIGKVEKSVSNLETDTAVRKSGDLGGSTEEDKLEKSNGLWSGTFLNV